MKIAVVGSCGSGKSTIAEHLKDLGFDAYVVGQEHSGVGALWNRRNPDVLVYLDVTLDAVRERRGENWPEWLFEKQQERLEQAHSAASFRINTAEMSVQETVRRIIDQLSGESLRQESSDISPTDCSRNWLS